MCEDESRLRADEIEPVAGWLEEGRTDDGESLWSLRVECREVTRSAGSSSVNLMVQWMDFGPLESGELAGVDEVFEDRDDPQASIYFFEHHAYGRAGVRVLSQQGARARVSVALTDDLYGLGIDRIELAVDVEVVPVVSKVNSD